MSFLAYNEGIGVQVDQPKIAELEEASVTKFRRNKLKTFVLLRVVLKGIKMHQVQYLKKRRRRRRKICCMMKIQKSKAKMKTPNLSNQQLRS